MLLVNQIKVRPGYTKQDVKKKISSILRVFEDEILKVHIEKVSVDARKKPDIFLILTASVEVRHEKMVLKHLSGNQVSLYEPVIYQYAVNGTEALKDRPIVVGAGPAGLICAYYLALAGYRPLVLERGYDIDSRTKDVEEFWETGYLKPNSNVQFGEGGAGAFSDGKLNTMVKDKLGRNRAVLELFVENGADSDILTDAKPHIGTDVLVTVVKNIREKTKSLGGEFHFNAEVTDLSLEDGKITGVTVNNLLKLPCQCLVLAIGHSARNTFEMLLSRGITLENKAFAVGLRVEHPQTVINAAMYGNDTKVWEQLPPAPYKLTYQSLKGRGVYSFCMCPGGYVVNASSEEGRTCVNGMSYKDRAGKHANSAIVVTVDEKDFGSTEPLAGMKFQRKLEEKAYALGNGSIPVEYYGDFKKDVTGCDEDEMTRDPGGVFENTPECKGRYAFGKVSQILPEEIGQSIVEGMEAFGKTIPGFNDDLAILSGVESRTSSPVRITRGEDFESLNTKGLFPCGEGAGYAGGIMSAAMDGMKVFEAVIAKYSQTEMEE